MLLRSLYRMLTPGGPREKLTVLIFHRVRAGVDPLFPHDLTPGTFEAQLGWIKHWFTVIPLREAVVGLERGRLPERPLCITFDDGYADNATVALPILRRLGLHATFFLASGHLNGGRMWNDTVIEAVRAAPGPSLDLADLGLGSHAVDTLAAKQRAIVTLLVRLKHLSAEQRAALTEAVSARVGARLPDTLMLTDAQVDELVRAGMEIGAHTVTHPILAGLPQDRARWEIAESKRRLEALTGRPVTLFAYPNGEPGRDYSAAHVAMVRDAGFEAAVSTAWGAAGPRCDRYQIPRFTPWDRTAWRYALRLAQNARRADYAVA
jgi:peptidoglycan/xylan/chitin deacetylase (PgdA/CDA1 family)